MHDTNILQRLTQHSAETPCPADGITLPCWVWHGHRNPAGYGTINVKQSGKWAPVLTHRAAYQLLRAPIPGGLDIDHLCRVRACWNPWHLEPVDRTTNVRRGIAPSVSGTWLRAKTHCPAGHPYDEINTRRTPSGRRSCRACARDRARHNRSKGVETS